MSQRNWTDRIVGDRMTVDRQFNERLAESEFTRQEWGLIMTASEFEIENPDEPERARLVADTSKVPQIIPELENIRAQMGGPQGADSSSSGGFLSSMKSAFGLGGGRGDAEKAESAKALVEEYAAELQAHLEEKGKWATVCEAASK